MASTHCVCIEYVSSSIQKGLIKFIRPNFSSYCGARHQARLVSLLSSSFQWWLFGGNIKDKRRKYPK